MTLFSFRSLRWRITGMLVCGIVLLASLMLFNVFRVTLQQNNQNLRETIAQTSQFLNLIVSPSMGTNDLSQLRDFLIEALPRDQLPDSGVTYVVILDHTDKRILGAGLDPLILPQPTQDLDLRAKTDEIHVRQRVLLSNGRVGALQYGYAVRGIVEAGRQIESQSLALTLAGVMVFGAVMIVLGGRLAKRIEDLAQGARALELGEFQYRIVLDGTDEVSQVAGHFNAMANVIGERFAELEATRKELAVLNTSLEDRVEERTVELQRAHSELAHAEKLASLGSMVAGISHELNTPLGCALTIGTTLEESFKSIQEDAKLGNLRRSALDRFLVEGLAMSRLAVSNIERAAGLVVSFKQVAVDQTSEQRRNFDLHQVIEDNLAAVNPTLKLYRLKVVNQVPPGLMCNSYPGPLGQIVTNIVQNAAIHGVQGKESGQLDIAGTKADGNITLRFADNGVGMSTAVLTKVFDPFFTTRLGVGGSGLGMSVSHRIATAVLGGNLTVTSTPSVGTTFTLSFPTDH